MIRKSQDVNEWIEAAKRLDFTTDQSLLQTELSRILEVFSKNTELNNDERLLGLTRLAEVAAKYAGPGTDRLGDAVLDCLASSSLGQDFRRANRAVELLVPRWDLAKAKRGVNIAVQIWLKNSEQSWGTEFTEFLLLLTPQLDHVAVESLVDTLLDRFATMPTDQELPFSMRVVEALASRMNSKAISKMVKILQQHLDWDAVKGRPDNAAVGFRQFAMALDSAQATVAVEKMLKQIPNTIDPSSITSYVEAIVVLLPKIMPDAKQRAETSLGDILAKSNDQDQIRAVTEIFKVLMLGRVGKVSQEIAEKGLRSCFRHAAENSASDDKNLRSFATLTTDWKLLAGYLNHPGCVGGMKDELLRRLEELLLRPKPTNFTAPLAWGSLGGGSWTAPESGGQTAILDALWESDRQWKSSWQAIEYIAKNHPEFPLGRMPAKPERK